MNYEMVPVSFLQRHHAYLSIHLAAALTTPPPGRDVHPGPLLSCLCDFYKPCPSLVDFYGPAFPIGHMTECRLAAQVQHITALIAGDYKQVCQRRYKWAVSVRDEGILFRQLDSS